MIFCFSINITGGPNDSPRSGCSGLDQWHIESNDYHGLLEKKLYKSRQVYQELVPQIFPQAPVSCGLGTSSVRGGDAVVKKFSKDVSS